VSESQLDDRRATLIFAIAAILGSGLNKERRPGPPQAREDNESGFARQAGRPIVHMPLPAPAAAKIFSLAAKSYGIRPCVTTSNGIFPA
jgi:hypothetical protein